MTEEPCPCGSGRAFAACCGPCLAGAVAAPTAEALMRSRYAAYARGDMDYLERTLLPRKRAGFSAEATRAWCGDVLWTGLDVVRTEGGGPDDETGLVEFVAHYVKAGEPMALHEVSRFRKKGGHWFYVDGLAGDDGAAAAPAPEAPRGAAVGRNSPCPCGSGKKYKRCCG
ncbi:MAG: YchJ family protein [Solidesulfovibrio sp. DCME]|uniref:YchJ family protein n=1 Tax=Solidesulfovibrio sp. DCME TaxID=3447380 RepID=UPI003D130741